MLFRVGVEPAKDIRGGGFLQFDGGDKAQDIVPERNDVFGLAIRVWFDFPGRLLGVFAAAENIQPLPLEILEARRVRDLHQEAGGEYRFAVSESIGGMNVALNHIVFQQTIDHVGTFALGGTEDQRVP